MAMVERYWGRGTARPQDYAHLVRPVETGIRTDELAAEVRDRGWRAVRVAADLEAVAGHLEEGRPVVLLLRVGPERFHYVVAVAVTGETVLVHDPARAPFRRLRRDELLRRWDAAGRWGLVVVPADGPDEGGGAEGGVGPRDERPEAEREEAGGGLPEACGSDLRRGVEAARAGRHGRADSLLRSAAERCPSAGDPLRELAGLRFRQERWEAAAGLAERALGRAPGDEHARRILGASRWLAGDVDGALRAWNPLAEPRLAGLRVYGLRRTAYETLRRQIGVPGGAVLTPARLAAARRRAAAVPAFAATRLDLRAPSGGRAEVEVAVLEEPLLPTSLPALAARGVRAAARRELALEASSAAGRGERWRVAWRWWEDRPRVAGSLAVPGAFGVAGVWSVRGSWERESFLEVAPGSPSAPTGAEGRTPTREERTRVRLDLSRWVSGGLRIEASAGRDDWAGLGARAVMEVGAEIRGSDDRLALLAAGTGWAGEGVDFTAGRIGAAARTDPDGRLAVDARAGLRAASPDAPRTEWPGAGTGRARDALLRAHPLLEGGAIGGPAFGRVLAHGTVEASGGLPAIGPLSPRLVLFGDVARPWRTGGVGDPVLHADAGAGIALGVPGLGGALRLDYARGLRDGADALTLRWEPAWPGW